MSLQQCDSNEIGSTLEKDAMHQHKVLMSLRQQHEELDRETEQKVAELKTAQKKRIILRDVIETSSIRIMKKEEALAKLQATSQSLQEEAKEIENKINKEKQIQIEYLKVYGDKMAAIADNLRSGPKLYDKKNITAEISSLQKENSAIAKQLISVGKEMNEVRMKYRSMFKESKDSPDITEAGTPELPALQCVISQMAEDGQLYNYEGQRLCEELKNLSKNLSTLEEELKGMKQGQSIQE